MKKIVFSLCLLAVSLGMANAQKIKGSDTVLPLSQKEAENYLQKHPDANVTVTGGGSGVGISALLEGTTDIAQSSRRIKFDERNKLKTAGKTVKEVIIAYDALAVVVHPSNPVKKLTREQLEGIFTGKIKNWKEVGGPDMKIVPYSRETSSGTYEFFKESVLKHRNYMCGIMSIPVNKWYKFVAPMFGLMFLAQIILICGATGALSTVPVSVAEGQLSSAFQSAILAVIAAIDVVTTAVSVPLSMRLYRSRS